MAFSSMNEALSEFFLPLGAKSNTSQNLNKKVFVSKKTMLHSIATAKGPQDVSAHVTCKVHGPYEGWNGIFRHAQQEAASKGPLLDPFRRFHLPTGSAQHCPAQWRCSLSCIHGLQHCWPPVAFILGNSVFSNLNTAQKTIFAIRWSHSHISRKHWVEFTWDAFILGSWRRYKRRRWTRCRRRRIKRRRWGNSRRRRGARSRRRSSRRRGWGVKRKDGEGVFRRG